VTPETRRDDGLQVPGPDGHLFGANGLLTVGWKKAGDTQRTWGAFAPATSGPWFVAVVEGVHNTNTNTRKVVVGLTTDEKVRLPLQVAGLPAKIDFHDELRWAEGGRQSVASRLRLVPEAETLAVLDDGLEKVHLHRVPLKELLEKSGQEYLMVTSRPLPATRGQKWTYTPEVWSKKGGAKVTLASGPDGMKAANGAVAWEVPAKFADPEVPVLITVSDASGKEVFHSFTLGVKGDK
jgi:hypothetical protein